MRFSLAVPTWSRPHLFGNRLGHADAETAGVGVQTVHSSSWFTNKPSDSFASIRGSKSSAKYAAFWYENKISLTLDASASRTSTKPFGTTVPIFLLHFVLSVLSVKSSP